MKLLDQGYEKDGEGIVRLLTEDDEDLWHLYNLILPGDTVRTSTLRKVQKDGVQGSQKIKMTLTIRVDKGVEFDPLAGELRFAGRNESDNEHVPRGSFHTLRVEKNQKVSIGKKCWDEVFVRRVVEACDPSEKADLAAVVMQEGIAHVCLITPSMTILKQKVEMPIAGKRRASATQHDKSLIRFFDTVLRAILQHIRWDIVKCFLVCSPGFVRDDFYKHCMAECVKREGDKEAKELLQNKGKFVRAQCSSGYIHSLKEVMSDPSLKGKLSETKAAGEVRVQEEYLEKLKTNEDFVAYGRLPVFAAAEMGVIRRLMVLDSVFRPVDLGERKRWVKLVEDVEASSGFVHIFSSMHCTGEWLSGLGGVAVILNQPCPELAELESESEEDSEADAAAAAAAELQARCDAAAGFAPGEEDALL
eukprot:Hpha_TRINITY_DN13865_c0_g1::TRINITY_DN13865_c0_g1_i2::g.69857::m.69857/K06965/PELO, DOM34, pelA; protein pelota